MIVNANTSPKQERLEQVLLSIEVRTDCGLYAAVPSTTREGRTYYISIYTSLNTHGTCQCEAAQRGMDCVHVLAVEVLMEVSRRQSLASIADHYFSGQATVSDTTTSADGVETFYDPAYGWNVSISSHQSRTGLPVGPFPYEAKTVVEGEVVTRFLHGVETELVCVGGQLVPLSSTVQAEGELVEQVVEEIEAVLEATPDELAAVESDMDEMAQRQRYFEWRQREDEDKMAAEYKVLYSLVCGHRVKSDIHKSCGCDAR